MNAAVSRRLLAEFTGTGLLAVIIYPALPSPVHAEEPAQLAN